MLVKALCTIHDSNGWHNAGEVFETEADLGDAVEAAKEEAEAPAAEPEKEPDKEPEPEKEQKPKSPRRKKISE